jgi:thiamine biosynthesis protein ThiS
MEITVNGDKQTLPDGITLRELIVRLGLADAPCAAEVNQRLVPRARHESTTLTQGDRVELVTLVGGG